MSINLTLVALDASLTEKLHADPFLSEEIEIEPPQDSHLASLGFPMQRTLSEDEYPDDRLALGKDWHLLDKLFTRGDGSQLPGSWKSSDIRSFLTAGGQPMGEGSGYGPARVFSAAECGDIDTFLEVFDASSAIEELTIDFVVREDVYVYSRGDIPIEEIRRIARVNLEEVKGFFRRASTTASSAYLFMS